MFTDMIVNGRATGEVGSLLGGIRFDPGLLRPYREDDGHVYVTINTGRTEIVNNTVKPIYEKARVRDLIDNGVGVPEFSINATTTLRKEEWIELDRVVLRAARYRLRAWSDLASRNSFGGFNGMSKLSLEYEQMSDPGEAVMDMDGLTEGRNDFPLFQLQATPLPITHSDFFVTARKLAVSRNTGTPLDSTMPEAAGRRVAETVEKVLLGVQNGITYGPGINSPSVGMTSQVYGYTNFPNRLTYTGTKPTGSNAATILANVLAMRDKLYANKFYGPFMIYHSNDWDQYLDNDYILAGGNVATQTLRQRLESIEGVLGVKRLDFLFGTAPAANSGNYNSIGYDNLYPFTMIMAQMTPDVARAINGMDITTVQWPTNGGLKMNFKVMCIQVPQLRCDYYNNCGILHATFS